MRRYMLPLLTLAVAVALLAAPRAQEVVTLTAPIAKPAQTTVRLERITLDILAKRIVIQWIGNNGEAGEATYSTPAPQGSSQPSGATLLTTLNKMNFAAGNPSFVARVIARLQSDGYVPAGTISGTPE